MYVIYLVCKWLGTVATLARDVPASAAYYASYELIQRRLAPNGARYSGTPHSNQEGIFQMSQPDTWRCLQIHEKHTLLWLLC